MYRDRIKNRIEKGSPKTNRTWVAPNVPILLVKDACEPLRKTCANEASKVIGTHSIAYDCGSKVCVDRE